MGADLYIPSLFNPTQKKYKSKFKTAVEVRNAFPRDSKQAKVAQETVEKYYELMYSKGYFRDSYNGSNLLWKLGLSYWHNKFINKKGLIMPTKAQELLELVKAGEVRDKYFKNKQKDFIEFLKMAIKLNEPIEASV